MEYLKIWVSFRQVINPLSDAEKGRLFEMMLRYAETGEEPSVFSGNERFLWNVAKQDIDRTAARAETLKANGSKGGRPKINDNQTEPNETKKNQEEANESLNIKKSNIKKSNVKKDNDLFDRFWKTYPRHENKQAAIKAFNKLGITEEMLMMLLSSIERQKESAQWKENGGQFIPHPATWLNGHRWEDELSQVVAAKSVNAQNYSQRDYSKESDDVFKQMIEQMEGHGA